MDEQFPTGNESSQNPAESGEPLSPEQTQRAAQAEMHGIMDAIAEILPPAGRTPFRSKIVQVPRAFCVLTVFGIGPEKQQQLKVRPPGSQTETTEFVYDLLPEAENGPIESVVVATYGMDELPRPINEVDLGYLANTRRGVEEYIAQQRANPPAAE